MPGIIAYSAYIPYYRLNRETISGAWSRGRARGEKAVASWDEDTLTLGVSAGLDCLAAAAAVAEGLSGLYFATTTSPYKEKQTAALAAGALDLPADIRTCDFTGSLRSATQALAGALDTTAAGPGNEVLVIAGDMRQGAPGSTLELQLGDAACALLVGNNETLADIEASSHRNADILDYWRSGEDRFVRSWEERFGTSIGYSQVMAGTIKTLLAKTGYQPADITQVIIYTPDGRSQVEVARRLGFDPAQLADTLFDTAGNTGSAAAFLSLANALDRARPGDRLLLASYGDGADAFILKVNENINAFLGRHRLKAHLATKRYLDTYEKYLSFRDLIPVEAPRLPDPFPPSAPVLWREREGLVYLHGGKCTRCGTIHYPPQRICANCQNKDSFETMKLAGKKGRLFTYASDYTLTPNPDPPTVYCCVDLVDGGRMQTVMTDVDPQKLAIGLEVEMTFRKIFSYKGVHRYGWKVRPAVTAEQTETEGQKQAAV
ncbi:MAG: 3-hydroxy-3-methylglutaryl CoA synthase [Clostridia bacterium]|nr:MAG: 3-hydroxy-3-methylglutaryl CoA synthase [Clostridia bacterium]